MKLRTLLFLGLLLPLAATQAQTDSSGQFQTRRTNKPVPKYLPKGYDLPEVKKQADAIDPQQLRSLVDSITQPAFEGRGNAQPGIKKAADYLADQFSALGLQPAGDRRTYLQHFDVTREAWGAIGLKVGARSFEQTKDFYVFPGYISDMPLLNLKEVIFVGYGIEDSTYNDYGKTDVKGKAVIFYAGEPLDSKGNSLITKNAFRSNWSLDWQRKLELAQSKGATFAFVIDQNPAESQKRYGKLLAGGLWRANTSSMRSMKNNEGGLNAMFVSTAVAEAILGKKAAKAEEAMAALKNGEVFKAVKVKSSIEVKLDKENETLSGDNVVGMIEGSDKNLKKEALLISAYYDHFGKPEQGAAFSGADNNASGVAALLEIARAMAATQKEGLGPKRTVVFLLTAGHEKANAGASFYSAYAAYPIDRTITSISLERLGRADDSHKTPYVYVVGADRSSIDMDNLIDYTNHFNTKLELDKSLGDADHADKHFENADNYVYVSRKVPAVSFFGSKMERSASASDTAEKLDYKLLQQRAQLVFYTAWDIANRPVRIGFQDGSFKAVKE